MFRIVSSLARTSARLVTLPLTMVAPATVGERERAGDLVDDSTWSQLAPELARIRARGHAVSEGEFEEELCACAMPVRTSWSTPASINVAVPASRWSRAYVEDTIRPALQAAEQGIAAAFRAYAVEDPT